VTTKELIEEVASLPVEERARVADSILRTLNPPEAEIDRKWAQVAQRRLTELRSGRVKPVPGEQVFAKMRKRFERICGFHNRSDGILYND
jgi:putative addiction module component (TIGR02574 family)